MARSSANATEIPSKGVENRPLINGHANEKYGAPMAVRSTAASTSLKIGLFHMTRDKRIRASRRASGVHGGEVDSYPSGGC